MTKIVSEPLREQAFESIKKMIRTGSLKQGDLLPGENKLAEMMGVSRVTVRWALKQLAEAGIIETRKGKGSVVAVDWKGVLEGELHSKAEECQKTFFMSTKARRLIEPVIARQAAHSATQEDIARMELALHVRDEEMGLYPILGKTNQHVDFHTCIWLSLHNPILMDMWKGLADTSALINELPLVPPTQRERQKDETGKQHQRIFQAIQRGEEDYAYLYMLQHCDWIREIYSQYFADFLK